MLNRKLHALAHKPHCENSLLNVCSVRVCEQRGLVNWIESYQA